MISWNIKDFNIAQVMNKSGLMDVQTKLAYRIYGLAPETECPENPPLLIEHPNNIDNKQSTQLIKFFKKKGVDLVVTPLEKENPKKRIYIGLRLDLRDNIKKTTACVLTVIHSLEGKIKKTVRKPKAQAPNRPEMVQEIH